MDTEEKIYAEGARVLKQRTDDPDRAFYLPQIKIAGVWVDVTRGDYSPHDFKSCVLSAMAAARGHLEPGDEVVWSVEEYEVADTTAYAHSVRCEYADEFDDETTVVPIEELDEPVIRIVRISFVDAYTIQFRVDNRWFNAATLPTVDAAVALAMKLAEEVAGSPHNVDPDDVVWVDRGSLKTRD